MLDQFTFREYPLWHGNDASWLLKKDLKDGVEKGMMLFEFQHTREEYHAFPYDIFRKHIYQDERKQREMPMKISTCNKLAEMQDKHVVDEEAAYWYTEQEHDDLVNEIVLML